MPYVPRAIRTLVLDVPRPLRALVPYGSRAVRALMPHLSYVLLYLTCLVLCLFTWCSCLVLCMFLCSSSLTCFTFFKPNILICISCLIAFMSCSSFELFEFFTAWIKVNHYDMPFLKKKCHTMLFGISDIYLQDLLTSLHYPISRHWSCSIALEINISKPLAFNE